MKVLVTGAHFTPAMAVIKELKKIDEVNIVYVGRKTVLEGDKAVSAESEVLSSQGIKFIPIITGRLQRTFSLYTIPSLLKIPIGLLQAIYIVLSEKPDVVLSFGGYVAVPLVIVAWFFSIPIIIHEQTLKFGLANKISSLLADKIAVSFAKTISDKKTVLTGNPIRQEIIDISPGGQKKMPTILIVGGNQGSHIINLAVEGCLQNLTKTACVYHQTGDSKYRDYDRLYQKTSDRYHVFKFIKEDWPTILTQCDLVVSRAGINTLTELAYLGKPALVIPIPNSEQQKNAKYFANLGLTKTLPESQLSGESLWKGITLMLGNLPALQEKAKEAKKIVIPDAAKRLALEIMLLVKHP